MSHKIFKRNREVHSKILVNNNIATRNDNFYAWRCLNALGINSGDLVGYTPNGEWEFLIDGKRLYCMKSNDIVIKYEYQGNEVEHNPSWAKSS